MASSSKPESLEKVVFRIFSDQSPDLTIDGVSYSNVFRTLIAPRIAKTSQVIELFITSLAKGVSPEARIQLSKNCQTLFLVSESGKTLHEFDPESPAWEVF